MIEYRIEITARAKRDLREVHAYISDNLKVPNITDGLVVDTAYMAIFL